MSERSVHGQPDRRADAGTRQLPRAFSDRRGAMIVAGVLASVGAFLAWQASMLDLGDVHLPGPGFFPLLLGVVLVISGALIGINRWRLPEGDAVELGHRDVLIAIAALLAVPIVFEPLGAYVTLGLLGTVMLVLIARIRFPLAIVAAAAGMAVCWVFFQQLLGLRLPTGYLGAGLW